MEKASIEKKGDHFFISGRLGFQNVVELWKESLSLIANEAGLHFDLSGVTGSNSAGVALMLEWIRYATEKHRAIDFRNIPSQLKSMIAISGIEQLISLK